jgi:shikimate dehydrogenase
VAVKDDIARIQSCIRNPLDRKAIGAKQLVAVIGDSPSRYSKSPSLWNAAFRALKMKAVYIALDVDDDRLPDLILAVRESGRLLGLQVTVPHKVAVMKHLDAIDEQATKIGAVNTITREEKNARLTGANTDGEGFVQSLLARPPGGAAPLIESLSSINALILGAGGSARAVGFALAEKLEQGRLLISNRTHESAASLAAEIAKSRANVEAIGENEIPERAPGVELIVNCTTKGQGGIRKNGAGMTTLEPYSALAPANPAGLAQDGGPEFYRAWLSASLADIEANNRASWKLALSIPLKAAFYDLIYHPEESVFLRHGRLTGHRTLNGRGMIVAQAVEAFCNHICRDSLGRAGLRNPETRGKLLEAMAKAW